MSNNPVDPRIRLAIAQWPEDAPRGAVSTFYAEHSISRTIFYRLRKRAIQDGQAAVLEPRSRRPKKSPTRIPSDVKEQTVEVRAAVERSGLDYGPISVHDKMKRMGLTPPSIASIARIFREKGVARLEPKKKPRAAWRRFVYPAPNACWQLDVTEYVLTGRRICVIFQLIDDHSRYAVASLVADGETSEAALAVMQKGIAHHGVLQRLLTDNGGVLNPSRRGFIGQLVTYVTSLGVDAITGKPGHPMTQGKNERFHQTLFRWLDKQPLAVSLADLQEQVDQFDTIYNTERGHQALPGRITPHVAWCATPKAEAPRPGPDATIIPWQANSPRQDDHTSEGIRVTRIRADGTIRVSTVEYRIGAGYARQLAYVVTEPEGVMFFDARGTLIAETPWPPEGTAYVGARQLQRPNTTSTMS